MLNFEMFEILTADEVQTFSVHHLPNFVVMFQATAEIWRFFFQMAAVRILDF